MRLAPNPASRLTGLVLLALTAGLLGSSGFSFAADRTVVGELWSQDG